MSKIHQGSSKIKSCVQCHTEFESHTKSLHCPSCSRQVFMEHSYVPKIVEGRVDNTHKGVYPRDYSRMKFGFSLMRGGELE